MCAIYLSIDSTHTIYLRMSLSLLFQKVKQLCIRFSVVIVAISVVTVAISVVMQYP